MYGEFRQWRGWMGPVKVRMWQKSEARFWRLMMWVIDNIWLLEKGVVLRIILWVAPFFMERDGWAHPSLFHTPGCHSYPLFLGTKIFEGDILTYAYKRENMQSVRRSYVSLKTLCCGKISWVRDGLHKICIKWWKYASKTVWVFIRCLIIVMD